jgi:ribosomal protein L37AE/L43A
VSAVAALRRRGGQLALVGGDRGRGEVLDLERPRRERANCSDGGRLTLEQRLDGVWEGLHAAGAADCPVCGAQMQGVGEGAARCGGCGSAMT